MSIHKLIWEDKYSVGVEEIDNQHKHLFEIVNEIFDGMGKGMTEEKLLKIISALVEYKKGHFETEEKYFVKFNYENTGEHVKQHHYFDSRIEEIIKKHQGDVDGLAFELVDFIEDWLIVHLMEADQKYKECFAEHGLK